MDAYNAAPKMTQKMITNTKMMICQRNAAREVPLRRGAAGAERKNEQIDKADQRDAHQEEGEHPAADGIVGVLRELVVCHGAS